MMNELQQPSSYQLAVSQVNDCFPSSAQRILSISHILWHIVLPNAFPEPPPVICYNHWANFEYEEEIVPLTLGDSLFPLTALAAKRCLRVWRQQCIGDPFCACAAAGSVNVAFWLSKYWSRQKSNLFFDTSPSALVMKAFVVSCGAGQITFSKWLTSKYELEANAKEELMKYTADNETVLKQYAILRGISRALKASCWQFKHNALTWLLRTFEEVLQTPKVTKAIGEKLLLYSRTLGNLIAFTILITKLPVEQSSARSDSLFSQLVKDFYMREDAFSAFINTRKIEAPVTVQVYCSSLWNKEPPKFSFQLPDEVCNI